MSKFAIHPPLIAVWLFSLILDKIYIGQTIKPVKQRMREHRCHKTSAIGRAIHKHGRKNFICVVLEECKSREELNAAEVKWIKILNTKAPNGYNLNGGGNGHDPVKSTRLKLSKAVKGRKDSLLTRWKKTLAQMGNTKGRALKGIPKSESHKLKISITIREIIYPNLNAELIKQNLTYPKLAEGIGIDRSTLGDKLNGKHPLYKEEMLAIQKFLKVDTPLEKLFATLNDDGTLNETLNVAFSKHNTIFPNLEIELYKQKITYPEIAKSLGVSAGKISDKMSGRRNLDKKFVLGIKELLNVDIPIEELFATVDSKLNFEDLPELTTKKEKKFFIRFLTPN